MGASPKGPQVAQRVVAHEHDVSSTPTVAAIRPALRHVGLATEAEAAVSATASLDVDPRSILHA
jgi:hypothetical protein